MGKLLFRIARLKIMGTLVGFVLAYLPFLLPVKKIAQTKNAIAFKHPAASYPEHILIIPRKIAHTAFNLSSADFLAVIDMAQKIWHGDDRDFVLVINGGSRQDVMQAHFHLFTGNLVERKGLTQKVDSSFLQADELFNLHSILRRHEVSEETFSVVIQFTNDTKQSMYLM